MPKLSVYTTIDESEELFLADEGVVHRKLLMLHTIKDSFY